MKKFLTWIKQNYLYMMLTVGLCLISFALGTIDRDAYDKARSSSMITANADVPTEDLDPEIGVFDISNYPTANYFDVTKVKISLPGSAMITEISNGIVNSIVIIVDDSVVGNDASTGCTLAELCPDMQSGFYYTISAVAESSDVSFIYLRGANCIWSFGDSLFIEESHLNSTVYFYGLQSYDAPVRSVISEIMINKGTVAYPYFPYYYNFYQNGYNAGFNVGGRVGYEEGHDEGYEEGYSEGVDAGRADGYDIGYDTGYEDGFSDGNNDGYEVGYEEGKAFAEYGIFQYFDTSITLYSTSGAVLKNTDLNIKAPNSIMFGNAYEELYAYNQAGAYLDLMFSTKQGIEFEVPLSQLADVAAYGHSDMFGEGNSFLGYGSDYYTLTWHSYIMSFETVGAGKAYHLVVDVGSPDPDLSDYSVSYFTIRIYDLEYLQSLRFVSEDTFYMQGYSAGYNEGHTDGFDDGRYDGFAHGKEEGEKEGFSAGRSYGYDEGVRVGYQNGFDYGRNYGLSMAEKGTFAGLINAVVMVPLGASKEFLNFEILEVNILGFVSGVLTLLMIVKLLRMFLAR